MTRITALAAAAITVLAGPAFAIQTEIDLDGDGTYSLTEVQTAMPEMSQDDFLVLDANGDGLLDADEVAAAIAAGFLPDPAS